ncbi:hypothetical protein CesoFtcFv8_023790 [Champsocephalus esox]|uniref:Uncharacterized protein n=1 Tax=Champsocephalus esox TaxID=159716 RepID=A0AAN8GHF0_9TELE|nr:hypothetical protein CesoFtcFv8_023790 [Champsocephalus esox]
MMHRLGGLQCFRHDGVQIACDSSRTRVFMSSWAAFHQRPFSFRGGRRAAGGPPTHPPTTITTRGRHPSLFHGL